MNSNFVNEQLLDSLNKSDIFKYLNLTIRYNVNKLVLNLIPIEKKHLGGSIDGSINGAVIAAISDIGIGATLALIGSPYSLGSGVARLNIRMRKPIVGNSLYAEASIDCIKKNLIYSRIEIFNEEKYLCAESTGVVFTK